MSLCANDPTKCCCPAGYTYTEVLGSGQIVHTECSVANVGADEVEDFTCPEAEVWMHFRCEDALASGLCDHEGVKNCYR